MALIMVVSILSYKSRQELELFLFSVHSQFVDRSLLICLVYDMLHHTISRRLGAYLQSMFKPVCDNTIFSCSGRWRLVDDHSAPHSRTSFLSILFPTVTCVLNFPKT